MKIILIGEEIGQSRNIEFNLKWLWFAAAAGGLLLVTLMVSIYLVFDRGQRIESAHQQLASVREQLLFEQNELNHFYTYADTAFAEYAKQAGLVQARVSRLEALGGRLVDMADFESEFDFYSDPALGGPEDLSDEHANKLSNVNILQNFSELDSRIKIRQRELTAIESLLTQDQLRKEQYVAGKPVKKGWLSSHFGKRIDPFHGRVRWHKGVDYAGDMGSEVLAVASGVVVWSGDRYGFGEMVEIDHGNGYVTRYAHNSKNFVQTGDVVSKGQTIAAMGSSGRSTGPHVHFEVLKYGKAVDPVRYIYRKTI